MAFIHKSTPKTAQFTMAQKQDISLLSVSDSNFFNYNFANLGLMVCFKPKNVSTFHWKEDRNFGFC